MNNWKEEYKQFRSLIKKANSIEELKHLDKRLMNLYNNGIFSGSQFDKLGLLLLDNQIALEA